MSQVSISDLAKTLSDTERKLYAVRRQITALEDEEKRYTKELRDANALLQKEIQNVTGYSPVRYAASLRRIA